MWCQIKLPMVVHGIFLTRLAVAAITIRQLSVAQMVRQHILTLALPMQGMVRYGALVPCCLKR